MFGFGKRAGVKEMKELLMKVQSQLSHEGLGQEMRMYQHGFVEKTKTFVQFGESFESEGMTAAGGLARYCHNALIKTIEPVDQGLPPMPIIIDLAEKMAYVALTLYRVVPEDELRDKDKIEINAAVRAANQWLAHDRRFELLTKVEERLKTIGKDVQDDGVVNALQNGQKYIQHLTAW